MCKFGMSPRDDGIGDLMALWLRFSHSRETKVENEGGKRFKWLCSSSKVRSAERHAISGGNFVSLMRMHRAVEEGEERGNKTVLILHWFTRKSKVQRKNALLHSFTDSLITNALTGCAAA